MEVKNEEPGMPIVGHNVKITPTTVDLLNGANGGGFSTPVVNYTIEAKPFVQDQPNPDPTPAPEPQVLKVALVGTAPSSRNLAPYGDPSWQIWVCSPGNMGQVTRVDRWFEIHKNLLWPTCISYGKPYLEWLNKQSFPIYMQDQELVPAALSYPKDRMIELFGRDFFTSSFAWMMAMAIDEGAKEIALYGIDMASPGEYALQRQSFYYFRREAEKRGIKVTAPYESDIMQSPGLYGWSDSSHFGTKLATRCSELDQRIALAEKQLQEKQYEVAYLKGAREDVDYTRTIWGGVVDN